MQCVACSGARVSVVLDGDSDDDADDDDDDGYF